MVKPARGGCSARLASRRSLIAGPSLPASSSTFADNNDDGVYVSINAELARGMGLTDEEYEKLQGILGRVDVVVLNDVGDYVQGIFSYFRDSRVEILVFSVVDEPFGMLVGKRQRIRLILLVIDNCPVRVEPGVKLHAPFMRLLDEKGQGIVVRCRCLTAHAI